MLIFVIEKIQWIRHKDWNMPVGVGAVNSVIHSVDVVAAAAKWLFH